MIPDLKELLTLAASAGPHQHGHEHGYGHEKTDTGVNNVAVLAGAFLGLLVFGLIVGYGTFRFFYTPEAVTAVPSPLEPGRVLPPAPRLQVNAREDLSDYVQQQQRTLSTYGWVDQKAGVARVPIDRAMDLLMQQGLPVRAQSPDQGSGNKRGTPAASASRLKAEAANATPVRNDQSRNVP